MSFNALSWATAQKPGNMAAKMALIVLANFANEDHESYPSTKTLADIGSMNVKTATAALDRLETCGLIVDTGKRQGRSGQVKVYRLAVDGIAEPERHPKTDALGHKSEYERHPKSDGLNHSKTPNFSGKDPQKRVTEPIIEPDIPPMPPQLDAGAIVDRWNVIADSNDLSPVRSVAERERVEALVQIQIDSFGGTYVSEALDRLAQSPYWLGRKGGEVKGWKPTPDWLFKAESLRKVHASRDRAARASTRNPCQSSGPPPAIDRAKHYMRIAEHCRKHGELADAIKAERMAQQLINSVQASAA